MTNTKPGWQRITKHAPWQPRDSAGELVFNDRLWILGGWVDAHQPTLRDVWSSADGIHWEQATEQAPWKHGDLAMTLVFKDRMWTLGGAFNGRLPGAGTGNEVWSSRNGRDWHQETARAGWCPRCAAGIAAFKGRIWILGGGETLDCSPSNVKNDVWASEDGVHWEQITHQAPWAPRAFAGTVVHDDRIWLVGGGTYNPYSAFNDVWSSPDGVHWEQEVADAPWTARIWFSTVVYRNRIWILGGWTPPYVNRNDIWHSADGKNWTQYLPEVMFEERHEQNTFVFQDKIWVAGGLAGLESWKVVNDVWNFMDTGIDPT